MRLQVLAHTVTREVAKDRCLVRLTKVVPSDVWHLDDSSGAGVSVHHLFSKDSMCGSAADADMPSAPASYALHHAPLADSRPPRSRAPTPCDEPRCQMFLPGPLASSNDGLQRFACLPGAGERWVFAGELTVRDATAELPLVLYDTTGHFFGGQLPLRGLGADTVVADALRGTLAALQNDVLEPRCAMVVLQS